MLYLRVNSVHSLQSIYKRAELHSILFLMAKQMLRFLALALTALSLPVTAEERTLNCYPTDTPPVINGVADDSAWEQTIGVSVEDASGEVTHNVMCSYDSANIYLVVDHLDSYANVEHKTQVWNKSEERYAQGPKREDTLTLKWGIDNATNDISISADTPYRADIWYWKAFRGNSTGFADDKFHIYSNEQIPRAKKLISKSGARYYLSRIGDKGQSTYKSRISTEFEGDETAAYEIRTPEGSRADVRAKGEWKNGFWTIEFARALKTFNTDDIQFEVNETYIFGISKYEISGGSLNESVEQPLYNTGDIVDTVELNFIP